MKIFTLYRSGTVNSKFHLIRSFCEIVTRSLLLPPATKLGQGYIFTGVCDSVHKGGGGGIPACIAGGIPACLAAGLGGGWYPSMPCRSPGPHPRGKLMGIWPRGVSRPTPGGVCSQGGV